MAYGILDKLKKGLEKTKKVLSSSLKSIFTLGRSIDEELLEELEEILISADFGVRPVTAITDHLRGSYKNKEIKEASEVIPFLKRELKQSLNGWDTTIHLAQSTPTVIMVAGVNGSGKTTSIAKLANIFVKDGKKVLLAACDTFRAAAVEQLEIWSKRVGVDIVKGQAGSDPAAVAFDAIDAAVSRNVDILIVDTAGRLHTQQNLMNELNKIYRVIEKKMAGAPHEVLLVLDATTGQNAIRQAEEFKEAINVTGIILAKLDGTAKGGIVIGMRDQIDIPVKFVGVGEKPDDIEEFDAERFVEGLFE